MNKLLKYKNIIIAVMVYVVWVIGFSFYTYQKSKTELYENIEENLLLAAQNYIYLIPDDLHHKNMSKSDLNKEKDRALLLISNEYIKINKITYIYSIVKVENKIYFTMGNGTEEDMVELKGGGYYFYPYDEAEQHVFDSFDASEPLFHDTTDHWGSFRSVFIPYISNDGTKFIIGADFSTSHINALLKKKLAETFIISILFLIFAIPILTAFTAQTRKWATNLKTQTEKANAANIAKSEFMNKMSHELRTPLHGIIAFSQIGVDKSDAGKIKDYFTNICKSGERLKLLLDDLLDFSKFEAGKIEMSFKNEDVKNIIYECIKEQEGLLNEYNLDISVTVDTDDYYAECDAARISQVILNLLNNAIKFSPKGTVIKFTITNVINNKDGSIHELQVSISDQGRGVPKSKRNAIFEKFTQELNCDDKITGTGLGLTISSEIILAHNGTIWCEESESGGAEFIFRIPVLHSQNKSKVESI